MFGADEPVLLKYLRVKNETLHAKARETGNAVSRLLASVPATFSHYTDHGISHCEEIVRQLGNLLFNDEDGAPIIPLSSAEAYLLIVSAYLHDAGMVVSEQEKLDLLASEKWKAYIETPHIADLWSKLSEQYSVYGSNESVERYAADMQMRYLIAEFFRRQHASRSASLILSQEQSLAGFAFGEPAVKQTIAEICAGHGLSHEQLDNPLRFPFRRDLLDERVNVRLLVILLRLGDLLDLRYQRACPITQSANSPLPAYSQAHWTQYARVTHRLVAPDRIEMRAECMTHQEHRILVDWFTWLVDEASTAKRLMANSSRHGSWRAPLVTIDGPNPTIEISASREATYQPVDWRFELDPEAVFERLIKDAYRERLSFISELVQNALDATRMRLSRDLSNTPEGMPSCPNLVASEQREKYPIQIEVDRVPAPSPLSSDTEDLVLIVRDSGTGMTPAIIEKYLLQVGRSFYTSPEFSSRFTFSPSSRFGIGFLSVFAVSKDVVLETRSTDGDEAVRITLTGPRSYLLFEKAARATVGTEIRVNIGNAFSLADIAQYVANRFKMAEFPVSLLGPDGQYIIPPFIGSDRPEPVTSSAVVEEGTVMYKSHRLDGPTNFGYLSHCVTRLSDGREIWARRLASSLAARHPLVEFPVSPEGFLCLNGISVGLDSRHGISFGQAERVDLRSKEALQHILLSRTEYRKTSEALDGGWQELVEGHLEKSPIIGDREWLYRLFVCADLIDSRQRIHAFPDTTRAFINGQPSLFSWSELMEYPELRILSHQYGSEADTQVQVPIADARWEDDTRVYNRRPMEAVGDWLQWLQESAETDKPYMPLADWSIISGIYQMRWHSNSPIVVSSVEKRGDWVVEVLAKQDPSRGGKHRRGSCSTDGFGPGVFMILQRSSEISRFMLVRDHPFTKALVDVADGITVLDQLPSAIADKLLGDVPQYDVIGRSGLVRYEQAAEILHSVGILPRLSLRTKGDVLTGYGTVECVEVSSL